MNLHRLKAFTAPLYEGKDMMHGLWHIELIYRSVCYIVQTGGYTVNSDLLLAATYFHGLIQTHEKEIWAWLAGEGLCEEDINKVIRISRESHASAVPESLEGKILHDAHLIEGGKAYMITKSLITGSLRGQTLPETIEYIERNIFGKRTCYLPEAIPLLEEASRFASQFLADLKRGLAR